MCNVIAAIRLPQAEPPNSATVVFAQIFPLARHREHCRPKSRCRSVTRRSLLHQCSTAPMAAANLSIATSKDSATAIRNKCRTTAAKYWLQCGICDWRWWFSRQEKRNNCKVTNQRCKVLTSSVWHSISFSNDYFCVLSSRRRRIENTKRISSNAHRLCLRSSLPKFISLSFYDGAQ